jgi:hypothetical protein
MRPFLAWLCVLALMACSENKMPPAGRWQGLHDSADAIIVARLEISDKGVVRVSAPNAFLHDLPAPTQEERDAIRGQLQASLHQAWPNVGETPLEFDGKVFQRPGGVAPQLTWDGTTMTLIVYPGTYATIRMPLQAVEEFD